MGNKNPTDRTRANTKTETCFELMLTKILLGKKLIGILAPHSLKLRRGNEGICEARVGMSANQGQSVENIASKLENGEGF
jgi:hypothetical protein